MSGRDPFANISPLDHRYWQANREIFDRLSAVLSDAAGLRYRVRVEVALVRSLADLLDAESSDEARALDALEREGVDPAEVAAEEEKTRHDVRALVNVLKRRVPLRLRPLVHLGATSYDVRDTAAALQLRDAVLGILVPLLVDLEGDLIDLCRREAETRQTGRTHGQFAVPITFGFAVAEYVSRLCKSIERIVDLAGDLRGKLSGAVGAYNATALFTSDPRRLESSFLSRLGLGPSDHATQIVEPEHALRLLLELEVAFGVIANLADDLRNLQRSEIDEVREGFARTQVGSSTMPQKRNPWNSEHVKSLWKAFMPRAMTFFMDQISEHQRDLTNSASSRFVPEVVAGLAAAANRMRSVVAGLAVDRERMLSNLASAGDMVLAEAAYILLSVSGEPDAHEVVRKLTLEAEASGRSLAELLRADRERWPRMARALRERAGLDPEALFADPGRYCGRAAAEAYRVVEWAGGRMAALRARLEGAG